MGQIHWGDKPPRFNAQAPLLQPAAAAVPSAALARVRSSAAARALLLFVADKIEKRPRTEGGQIRSFGQLLVVISVLLRDNSFLPVPVRFLFDLLIFSSVHIRPWSDLPLVVNTTIIGSKKESTMQAKRPGNGILLHLGLGCATSGFVGPTAWSYDEGDSSRTYFSPSCSITYPSVVSPNRSCQPYHKTHSN